MKKYYLMAPGPTPVPSNVLLAMAQPIINHRTPEYEALFIEVRAGLKRLFQTSQDVIPFTSSGTGAMEAAVVNTLSSGDTVLVALKRFESEAVNVLLALLIASIKASLVALFFMHLKFEGKLIYMIFIVPLALCVLLIVALLPDLLPIGDASLQHFNPPPMTQSGPPAHH